MHVSHNDEHEKITYNLKYIQLTKNNPLILEHILFLTLVKQIRGIPELLLQTKNEYVDLFLGHFQKGLRSKS